MFWVSYGFVGGIFFVEFLVEVLLENYLAIISFLVVEFGEIFDLGLYFSVFNWWLMGVFNFFRLEIFNFLNFVYVNVFNYFGCFNFWERDV